MSVFLKKIEIQGFKSFANKTTFEFPAKIIGVVGPNGSGKSNIVDALRWALGERAAKNLRGESLENLIFAGTPKKPASSLARVSLHFTNHENIFPVETSEAVIERKIDKAGASQFFINSVETRLRDLHPILARAKMGTRGMTIIGQGQSDLFVKSSPKERRIMIEEILGLKEYRLKKEEAERRVETSRSNMEKIKAMIDEITPHLKFLRKQKSRWEEREKIEEKLKHLENSYFGFRIKTLREEKKSIEEKLLRLEVKKKAEDENTRKKELELRELEKEKETSKESEEVRNSIERLFEEKLNIERELIRLETRIEIRGSETRLPAKDTETLLRSIRGIEKEAKSLLVIQNMEELKEEIAKLIKKLEALFEEPKESKEREARQNITEALQPLKRELENIEKKLREEKEKEKALGQKQKNINQQFRTRFEEIERERNKTREIERKVLEIKFEKEKTVLRINELEKQWQALERTGDELEKAIRGEWTEITAETNWQQAERRILLLCSELSSIGEIDNELVKEAEDTETRYVLLEKEYEDLGRTEKDLSVLIAELDERIHGEFKNSFKKINDAFNTYFGLMFGGGKAKLKLSAETEEHEGGEHISGVDFEISIPRKKIKNLDMLSGGEKSLVSMAALFSLISISSPPILILDEIDAALDEENARRFAELVKNFSDKTQFLIVTHNRITMETADVLYGITMGDDGVSKVLSIKLETTEQMTD